MNADFAEQLSYFFVTFVISIVLVAILTIASMWRIFTKAGKPGWAVLIPFYNWIVLLEIARKPMWWLVLLIIPLANVVAWMLITLSIAKSFGKSPAFAMGMIFLPLPFYPMLAFGTAQYEASESQTGNTSTNEAPSTIPSKRTGVVIGGMATILLLLPAAYYIFSSAAEPRHSPLLEQQVGADFSRLGAQLEDVGFTGVALTGSEGWAKKTLDDAIACDEGVCDVYFAQRDNPEQLRHLTYIDCASEYNKSLPECSAKPKGYKPITVDVLVNVEEATRQTKIAQERNAVEVDPPPVQEATSPFEEAPRDEYLISDQHWAECLNATTTASVYAIGLGNTEVPKAMEQTQSGLNLMMMRKVELGSSRQDVLNSAKSQTELEVARGLYKSDSYMTGQIKLASTCREEVYRWMQAKPQ